MKKTNNIHYNSGYIIGLTKGPIKELVKLINKLQMYGDTKEEILRLSTDINNILLNYQIANDDWEMIEGTISKKDIQVFLLGYVEGKNSNVNNRAAKKYQQNKGLISKSYKLDKKLTEQFAETCAKKDVSAAAALTKFMKEFIDSKNN